MTEKPYSKREIDQLLSTLEGKLLDENEGILPRIERQTVKTNGRVTRLERAALIIIGAIGAAGVTNPDLLNLLKSFF